MIRKITDKLILHQSIIKYGLCSVAAAVLEVIFGWILLRMMPGSIVVTNTIAIVSSSIVHYLLIQNFVFEQKNNIESILVYIISFGIGVLLQDFLIWLIYSKLLQEVSESWRYLISKGVSLVIPFFALYYIRSKLNEIIKKRHSKGEQK